MTRAEDSLRFTPSPYFLSNETVNRAHGFAGAGGEVQVLPLQSQAAGGWAPHPQPPRGLLPARGHLPLTRLAARPARTLHNPYFGMMHYQTRV